MRNTRFVMFVVASLASTVSLAGAQASTPATARASHAGHGMEGHGRGKALLRGVTLNSAEKAKIKEIRSRYRPEEKTLHESLRPAMQEARTARQRGDTAAARVVLERTKGDRAKMRALMERESADVRSALSPEHQTQFDANVRQAAEQRASAKQRTGGKGHRHSRAGKVLPATNS